MMAVFVQSVSEMRGRGREKWKSVSRGAYKGCFFGDASLKKRIGEGCFWKNLSIFVKKVTKSKQTIKVYLSLLAI